jgi:hypothetical protein
VEWGGLLEWVKIGGLSQQGLTAMVRVWWGDGYCSGSAVGGPREVIRGTLAAIREGATFGLWFDSRGRVGIRRGHPSKRPRLWTCTGGSFYTGKYRGYALPYTVSRDLLSVSHGSPGELPPFFLLKRRPYASFSGTKNISRICLTTYYDPQDLTDAFPCGILA